MQTMSKAVSRCRWAEGVSLEYIEYHDKEWGVPVRDDKVQFEFLILEGAQAGLSWSTILKKREGYRRLYDGFDPRVVARYGDHKRAELLSDPAIVRNRAKIAASIANARAFLAVQAEFGSFSDYIWRFTDVRMRFLRSMASRLTNLCCCRRCPEVTR